MLREVAFLCATTSMQFPRSTCVCSDVCFEMRTLEVHLPTAIIGTDVGFGPFTWGWSYGNALSLSPIGWEWCHCQQWNYWHIMSQLGEEFLISRCKYYHLTRRKHSSIGGNRWDGASCNALNRSLQQLREPSIKILWGNGLRKWTRAWCGYENTNKRIPFRGQLHGTLLVNTLTIFRVLEWPTSDSPPDSLSQRDPVDLVPGETPAHSWQPESVDEAGDGGCQSCACRRLSKVSTATQVCLSKDDFYEIEYIRCIKKTSEPQVLRFTWTGDNQSPSVCTAASQTTSGGLSSLSLILTLDSLHAYS